MHIVDCDGRFLNRWGEHLESVEQTQGVKMSVRTKNQRHGRKHWPNLILWCKLVWKGSRLRIRKSGTSSDLGTVVAAAHEIALAHRKDSWERCHAALENLRFVVCKLDQDWAREA